MFCFNFYKIAVWLWVPWVLAIFQDRNQGRSLETDTDNGLFKLLHQEASTAKGEETVRTWGEL